MTEANGDLVRKTFFGILIVNVISMVSGILCTVIDAVVTGQFLGTEAVAASGLITPVVMLVSLLGLLFGPGVSIVCTRYMGMAKPERVRQVFSVVIFTALLLSCVGAVLLFFLSPIIAHALGESAGEGISERILDYLRGFAFAIPMLCLSTVLSGLMVMDNDRKRGIAAMLVTLLGDTVFDLANVLIFHGGMLGMSLATALSCAMGLVVLLTHFHKKDRVLSFTREGLRVSDLKEVVLCGVSSVLSIGSQSLRILCFNLFLLSLAGSSAVAALSVANSAFTPIFMAGTGLLTATSALCSLLYGEEDRGGLLIAFGLSLRVALLGFAVLSALLLAFAAPIARLFLDASSSSALAQGTVFIRAMAVQYLLQSVNYAFCGAYLGTQQPRRALLISLMREGVFPILCCMGLGVLFGIRGFPFGFALAGALTLLLCFVIPWKRSGHISLAPQDLLLLPAEFGSEPEELYEASMQTIEDVMDVSAWVMRFCESRGASHRTAFMAALFVEEMAVNTILHGFPEGRRGSIDLRLVYGEEAKVIRLRDNGRPFDPAEWLRRNQTEDPSSGVGIRIVIGLAKDVLYIPAMGLNNLVIKL